jgi:hypothetical protein
VTKVLKQMFLTKYIAPLNAGMEQLNKRLQKDISSLELAAGLAKLENARSASKTCQYITMSQYAASA